jgi:hypothetical protein
VRPLPSAACCASAPGNHPASRRYVLAEMPRMDRESFRWVWAALESYDGSEHLPGIACPTWIVVGAENRRTHVQARRPLRWCRGRGWWR